MIRDLPAALVRLGWSATVLTPSYGMFAKIADARLLTAVDVTFRGKRQAIDAYEVPGVDAAVRNIVFEHELFSPLGPGQVYAELEAEGPFATDAGKFALLGAAAAEWIRRLAERPDVVHLHDWHAAFYCLLRNFDPKYRRLQKVRTVFTIHNLAYQGTRPLKGDESSLEEWFPGLHYDTALLRDPHVDDCVNPMALAIRTADKISTVSPTYAEEIRRPSDTARGFYGGEGLEVQLENAARMNRLVGILNGCEYNGNSDRRPRWQRILAMVSDQVNAWVATDPDDKAHALAQSRLASLPQNRPEHVMVSIGRLVRQKVSLFLEPLADGRSALEHILDRIGTNSVVFLLGSGEAEFEQRVLKIAARYEQLLFLRGYSETLADPLYRGGDLFLMPSSFEPCGISQMLAMRAAQPCVVHGVGGLCDTVKDAKTGFVFSGDHPAEQATGFVAAVDRALAMKTGDNDRWQTLCIRAASERFDWKRSAQQTVDALYEPQP